MLTILSCTIDLLNSRLENFDFFSESTMMIFFYLFMMGSCVSFLANLWLFFLNMGPRLMKLRKINYYSLSSKAEKIHIESSFLDPVVDSFQGPFAIEHLWNATLTTELSKQASAAEDFTFRNLQGLIEEEDEGEEIVELWPSHIDIQTCLVTKITLWGDQNIHLYAESHNGSLKKPKWRIFTKTKFVEVKSKFFLSTVKKEIVL